jgi:hypothetical protein
MARQPKDDRCLTISEAARRFRVTRQQIHNLLNEGVLRTVERRVVVQLIAKADLQRIAESRGWVGKGKVKRGRPSAKSAKSRRC